MASFSTFVVTPFHGCFVLFKDSDVQDFRTHADNGAVVHNAFRKTLGRVDEDVMGRSGQLVRPRSLDAGGVAGGRNWWRGWWLGLFFHRFFLHFWSPWARKIDQNCSKSQNRRKNRKITKKLPKTDQRLFDLGSPNGLEIHQKCRKNGSKKSVKKITLQNTAVLAQGGIFRRKTLRFRGISG